MSTRRLRMGMVGGGPGAFIGQVHRMAAALAGGIDLVSGAFCTDADASRAFGLALGLAQERSHGDYRELLATEAVLPENERIDFLSIVTPNASHRDIACAALDLGIAVFCEKPVAISLSEAQSIADACRRNGRQFALAHTYAGYPMVIEARQRVRRGDLGRIRKIVVDYTQGWLAPGYLPEGQKQAAWRLDPMQSGPGGCLGDIGIHAAHIAEFVGGARITDLLADLGHVGGQRLDDDVTLLLRFDNEARGVLNASQICVGEENNLSFRIYGERGHLSWQQQRPDTLKFALGNAPVQALRAGHDTLDPLTYAQCRLPPGHPEGYIEAFANLYREFAAVLNGKSGDWLPGIDDGLRGMRLIETAIRSSTHGGVWLPLDAGDAG